MVWAGREAAKERGECGKPCWEVMCPHGAGRSWVLGKQTHFGFFGSFTYSNTNWPHHVPGPAESNIA